MFEPFLFFKSGSLFNDLLQLHVNLLFKNSLFISSLKIMIQHL